MEDYNLKNVNRNELQMLLKYFDNYHIDYSLDGPGDILSFDIEQLSAKNQKIAKKILGVPIEESKNSLIESEDSDDELYFSNYDGTIVQFYKDGSKWIEGDVDGDEPYGWGSKTYGSYLSASDLAQYLSQDYGGRWRKVSGFSDEDENEYNESKRYKMNKLIENKLKKLIREELIHYTDLGNHLEFETKEDVSKFLSKNASAVSDAVEMKYGMPVTLDEVIEILSIIGFREGKKKKSNSNNIDKHWNS